MKDFPCRFLDGDTCMLDFQVCCEKPDARCRLGRIDSIDLIAIALWRLQAALVCADGMLAAVPVHVEKEER
jgi:hypothetical protein